MEGREESCLWFVWICLGLVYLRLKCFFVFCYMSLILLFASLFVEN